MIMNLSDNTLETGSFFEKLKNIFHIAKGTTKEVKDTLNRERPTQQNTKAEILAFFEKDPTISIEMAQRVNERLMRGEKSDLPKRLNKVTFTEKEINAAWKKANEQFAQDPKWQAFQADHQKQMDELIKQAGAKPTA